MNEGVIEFGKLLVKTDLEARSRKIGSVEDQMLVRDYQHVFVSEKYTFHWIDCLHMTREEALGELDYLKRMILDALASLVPSE